MSQEILAAKLAAKAKKREKKRENSRKNKNKQLTTTDANSNIKPANRGRNGKILVLDKVPSTDGETPQPPESVAVVMSGGGDERKLDETGGVMIARDERGGDEQETVSSRVGSSDVFCARFYGLCSILRTVFNTTDCVCVCGNEYFGAWELYR